jgi:dCTP deaminase
MILSAQSIRRLGIISPFSERTVVRGLSYGLSSCGYDVRVKETVVLRKGYAFSLASTIEHFDMPFHVVGRVHDKSTWARRGLAIQNTIIEPGWRGYLTLELSNNCPENTIVVEAGDPIAQIIFELLDEPTEAGYNGKYQDQPGRPVGPKLEN